MKKLCVPRLSEEQHLELEQLYRKTEVSRSTHLSADGAVISREKLTTNEIADIVRESFVTVWICCAWSQN